MKKATLFLALVFALPVLAAAQNYPYEPEGKIMDDAEQIVQIISQLSKKEKKAIEEKIKYREVYRKEALVQAEKAEESLKALIKAYPDHEETLKTLSDMHTYFVEFSTLKHGKNEKQIYGYIFQQLESFYALLEELPDDLADITYEIVNHNYWIEISQESLTLPRMGAKAKVITGVFESKYF